MADQDPGTDMDAAAAVVIPCYRQAHLIRGAIESALLQSVPPAEIILVDDGSDDDLQSVASSYPQVTFLQQGNRGLAAARNTGLRAASSDKVIFLDADDLLLPDAVASGLACFSAFPDAGFVYGGFREAKDDELSERPSSPLTRSDLIRCNWIAMIASVMFDRDKLVGIGGFNENLGMCEDWDAYLRLSRRYSFGCHCNIVATYVRHAGNMSNAVPKLRKWIRAVRKLEKARGLTIDEMAAWHEGEAVWRSFYPRPARDPVFVRVRRRLALMGWAA